MFRPTLINPCDIIGRFPRLSIYTFGEFVLYPRKNILECYGTSWNTCGHVMEHFDILLVVRKEFYVVYYIPNEEFYLLYTSVIFVEMPLETCHFTGIAVKCNTSEINCERSEVSVSERAEQALPD